jgi:nucleoside-diphosphate-sugar epimerase
MSGVGKKVLVCGAGGFIGGHLVTSLKKQGYYVIGVDIKEHEYKTNDADEFHLCDLREQSNVRELITSDIDTVYQLAADMGGAGYIFTGENDANIMRNSVLINLNVAEAMVLSGVKNVFYTSSACVYPGYNQKDPNNPLLSEESAYPADPDSEYGWEKLFSERLWMSFSRNYDLRARIARLHNIFGPLGSWNNGREKSPAALCRKVAESTGEIEVWGPGVQTRSFLYIDECIKGIHRIQASNCDFPLNLGSERMISINGLAELIATIAGKPVKIQNVPGPMGVMGRNSHNRLIKESIGWAPADNLEHGLSETYRWIKSMIDNNIEDPAE